MQNLVDSEGSVRLEPILMDLIDAVRFAQNAADASIKERGTQERVQKQLEELELLRSSVSDSLLHLRWVDETSKSELSRNITNFVNAAVEQVKTKLKASLKKDQEEYRSASESERLKAAKSLEAFLASNPLPILDRVISLKHLEASYAAKVRYRAEGEIQYEFTLNSSDSKLFRTDFNLGLLAKEIKLPVRLSKTWLKKDPVPNFERLDQYVLEKAEVSKKHLVASFSHPETGSSVEVVFSKSASDSFVTAEYSDPKGRVDVTGQPSLSKHLDLATLKETLEQLLGSIEELERSKLSLSRLKMNDEDVLEKLDSYGFMLKVLEVLGPRLQRSGEALRQENSMLRERLKLLGDKARPVVKALGIPESMLNESDWAREEAD
jgi:uncharacterized protein (UPF0335 family)